MLTQWQSSHIWLYAGFFTCVSVQGFMHYFVKRLITCALDKNNREREMASVLLSSLYANVRNTSC